MTRATTIPIMVIVVVSLPSWLIAVAGDNGYSTVNASSKSWPSRTKRIVQNHIFLLYYIVLDYEVPSIVLPLCHENYSTTVLEYSNYVRTLVITTYIVWAPRIHSIDLNG
jgi:hypothetical protein